ncbi:hypothetical protein BC830DRAFT_503301 [Chytriomyces sp. MP71]|nr:hypothetical protein BC830DRAFT_503301 [Chytriomyces sp. MP71]
MRNPLDLLLSVADLSDAERASMSPAPSGSRSSLSKLDSPSLSSSGNRRKPDPMRVSSLLNHEDQPDRGGDASAGTPSLSACAAITSNTLHSSHQYLASSNYGAGFTQVRPSRGHSNRVQSQPYEPQKLTHNSVSPSSTSHHFQAANTGHCDALLHSNATMSANLQAPSPLPASHSASLPTMHIPHLLSDSNVTLPSPSSPFFPYQRTHPPGSKTASTAPSQTQTHSASVNQAAATSRPQRRTSHLKRPIVDVDSDTDFQPGRGEGQASSSDSSPDPSETSAKKKLPMEAMFPCEVCGKSFRRKHHIESHMVTHSNEYPYVCDIGSCSAKFRRIQDLRRHQRNVKH